MHMCVHEPRHEQRIAEINVSGTCRRIDTLDLAILNDERGRHEPLVGDDALTSNASVGCMTRVERM